MKNIQLGFFPGAVRYNSSAVNALTDKGYYVLIAQDVLGTGDLSLELLPGTFVSLHV